MIRAIRHVNHAREHPVWSQRTRESTLEALRQIEGTVLAVVMRWITKVKKEAVVWSSHEFVEVVCGVKGEGSEGGTMRIEEKWESVIVLAKGDVERGGFQYGRG